MSHWYRRPRANSVWSLLGRLQRGFLLDGCICDDARHIFLDGTRADIPWGLLLLPNQHNEQIEILQQLSIGQLRFDSVNKPKFNINCASRNNFLVNLRQAPPVVRILHHP